MLELKPLLLHNRLLPWLRATTKRDLLANYKTNRLFLLFLNVTLVHSFSSLASISVISVCLILDPESNLPVAADEVIQAAKRKYTTSNYFLSFFSIFVVQACRSICEYI